MIHQLNYSYTEVLVWIHIGKNTEMLSKSMTLI